MLLNLAYRLWQQYRPDEGWLPLFLLFATLLAVVGGVLAVQWVPEDNIIVSTAVLGFVLAVVLAKRPLSTLAAWFMLTSYGLLWPLLLLGQLFPTPFTLWQGWAATTAFWRQNGAFLWERINGWLMVVGSGGRSQETAVFALGLSLLTWFLAAYLGWSAYRQKRPLLGLSLLGMATAINSYFGVTNFIWPAAFVALAALTAAMLHFANLEQFWQRNEVDYSLEIRTDLFLYTGGIATLLLIIALVLPAFNISRLREFVRQQTAVVAAEEGLERALDGVRQPRRETGTAIYEPNGSGILPRAFLLGTPPELAQTVVMHASLRLRDGSSPPPQPPTHWRGLSYTTYSGRGWVLAEEQLQVIPANQLLVLPPTIAQTVYEQQVNWVLDNRILRYTVGFPLLFDQQVLTLWNDSDDLVRVQGQAPSYRAVSQLSNASATELQTAVGDIPATIQKRYTQLPATLPSRVGELAQQVAGHFSNPYDQARELERFLRQYPYSLSVGLPPNDTDPVDYFLFELQQGYCDYYASAMVLLARSLGLPARLVTGYLAQPPDENGLQHIRQLDAHSWVEVYFAEYGWVEFEPTAVFATPHDPIVTTTVTPTQTDSEVDKPLPLPPQSEAKRPFPWSRLLWLTGLGGLLWWFWRQQHWLGQQEGVYWAYSHLLYNANRLGLGPRPGQTATEFTAALIERLAWLGSDIEHLTTLFVQRQYGRRREEGDLAAVAIWGRLKRPFWRLRLRKWLRLLPKNL